MALKSIKLNKLKGLTIIETILYIGLFGIIFSAMLGVIFNITYYNYKADSRKELYKGTMFLAQHLSDSFKKSSTIDTVNSIFLNNSGKLKISNSSTTYTYTVLSNRIQFSNGVTTSYLTDSKFNVNKFYLEEVKSSTGVTTGCRITLLLSIVKEPTITTSFTTMYSIKW